MPHIATTSPNDIQHLVQRLVGQITEGCGAWSCENALCDTGRRNAAPSNRPVRKWTPRSARTIAITIAGGPRPEKYLCHSSRPQSPETASSQAAERHERSGDGPRDTSSTFQLLSDTSSVRHFCDGYEPAPTPRDRHSESLRSLQPLLLPQVPDRLPDTSTFISNPDAAHRISHALDTLCSEFPTAGLAQYEYVDSFLRNGSAFPPVSTTAPVDAKWNCWLHILDMMDDRSAMRLLSTACKAFAMRTKLQDELADLGRAAKYHFSSSTSLASYLVPHFEEDSEAGPLLVPWCKKAFLAHWDGSSAFVRRGSVACGALELIEFFSQHLETARSFCSLPIVANSLDSIDLAKSWTQKRNTTGHRHLLSFAFLFAPQQRALYFRTVSHLKMREAVSLSEQAVAMRRRMLPHMLEDEPEGRLRYLDQQYLLLNVSRTDALRDAYNQLWQRRQGELFRPLRIRLGEVDELEIGHDLGGVQMEFFNLVCQEAFREEAGMFTTNAQTGLSYFRAGSLQPLYTFELMGLLMGLALHNGITLPINLPLIFYAGLITDGSRGDLDDDTDLVKPIRDCWPTEARSLCALLAEDVEDLEYSFPLEANGLSLAVWFPSPSSPPCIASATDDRGRNVDPSVIRSWPGWVLPRATPESGGTGEPITVTADNKADYVHDYVWWLFQGSVVPQWESFTAGFYRVVDRRSLSMFSAFGLKSFVEGSSHLNIAELRKATQYDGYDAKSKYIQTFWRIVSNWPEEKQKQLLKFVTAAERIPMGGASQLTFVIKRTMVEDLEHLPTSSTCFGTLYLPRYASAEALHEKLSRAIEYGLEGFGTG